MQFTTLLIVVPNVQNSNTIPITSVSLPPQEHQSLNSNFKARVKEQWVEGLPCMIQSLVPCMVSQASIQELIPNHRVRKKFSALLVCQSTKKHIFHLRHHDFPYYS